MWLDEQAHRRRAGRCRRSRTKPTPLLTTCSGMPPHPSGREARCRLAVASARPRCVCAAHLHHGHAALMMIVDQACHPRTSLCPASVCCRVDASLGSGPRAQLSAACLCRCSCSDAMFGSSLVVTCCCASSTVEQPSRAIRSTSWHPGTSSPVCGCGWSLRCVRRRGVASSLSLRRTKSLQSGHPGSASDWCGATPRWIPRGAHWRIAARLGTYSRAFVNALRLKATSAAAAAAFSLSATLDVWRTAHRPVLRRAPSILPQRPGAGGFARRSGSRTGR